MAEDEAKLHIAMFPWLAFGHMLPFLELSKLIAQKGHKISFISTPRNIDRLPKLPTNLASLITFVKLPLPPAKNLPEKAEATTDLAVQDVSYLKTAYDLLKEPLTEFLQSSLPDWVVFDYVPFWLPSVARKLNIPNAYFSIFLAAVVGFASPPSGQEDYRKTVEDFTVKPRWVPFESTVAYRHFEAVKCFPALVPDDESQIPEIYRFREVFKGCDLIAVRSSWEFEPDWLKLLEEIHKKPVFPVGVLPSSAIGETEEEEDQTWRSIKQWLDKQERASVVYIAFGSEAKPSQEELTEIAYRLELSNLPFFWVLRTRRNPADTEVLELPEGFEERTKERGVVWKTWAPQVKILSHELVGGSLTHSGWSSVVEALQFARPLVLLTFYADQGFNAKLLQEKKIGYLVPRNEEDGLFSRDSVAESLRAVVVEEEEGSHRDKAMELKGLFADREKQDNYVEVFLGYLKANKRINTENVRK